ncbi:MAG: membrane dipeptidase [Verrucomicrobia bacterium]|nr:membrane dipeptidase [Verrucomicrobiota bacterium]
MSPRLRDDWLIYVDGNEKMQRKHSPLWQRIREAREKALSILKPSRSHLEHGLELHRASLVVDAFGFAPYSMTANMVETLNRVHDTGAASVELNEKQLELRITEQARDAEAREQYATAWRESGVTGTMQTCGGESSVASLMAHFSRFFLVWDRLPEVVFKATAAPDVGRAKSEGRYCQFVSLNGVPGLSECGTSPKCLDILDVMHRLGCRMIHLTYNRRNLIGDGCIERENRGLSDFGREVLKQMNELGILADTPHTGKQTTLDAARLSCAPIAASHTSCRALCDHDRGKSDEEMKAIADTGGFIGICAIPPFLGEAGTIQTMLDHIDYAVNRVGMDHVAIGTDVGFVTPYPETPKLKPFAPEITASDPNWRPEHRVHLPGIFDECHRGSLAWTNWSLFTVGLVQRGYSDDKIQKIIGKNVLRVLANIAAAAKQGRQATHSTQ